MKLNILFAFLLLSLFKLSAQGSTGNYLKAAMEATENKDYSTAIKYCDAAITLNNTSIPAYFHRGYNKVLLKDYDGALIDFTVCLDLNPDNISAYLYRALTFQKLGKTWEATQDYNRARRIDMFETMAFITANLFK